MVRRMSNSSIENVAGGNPKDREIQKVDAPGNRKVFVVADNQKNRWISFNAVEYFPGTFSVTRNTYAEISEVLKDAIDNFNKGTIGTPAHYTISQKDDSGNFRDVGTNSGTENVALQHWELKDPRIFMDKYFK